MTFAARVSFILSLACFALPDAARGQFSGVLDDIEPNNVAADAFSLGAVGTGVRVGIFNLTMNDVDFLRFSVTQVNTIVTILTAPLSGPPNAPFSAPDTVMQIRNNVGASVVVNDDAGVDGPGPVVARGSVVRAVLQPGEYSFRLSGFDASDTGNVFVMMSTRAAGAVDAGSQSIGSIATAQRLDPRLGGPIVALGSFTAQDQSHFYKVHLNVGDSLFVLSTPQDNVLLSSTTALSLFEPGAMSPHISSSGFESGTNSTGTSSGGSLRMRARMTGDHVLRVTSISNFPVGSYTLSLALLPGSPVCSADLNHDGIVDAQDLSAVLGSWGMCP